MARATNNRPKRLGSSPLRGGDKGGGDARGRATALVPLPDPHPDSGSRELALPADLISKTKNFAVNAKSARTRKEYARCWRDFTKWCELHGRDALPASYETVAAYLSWLASGRGGATKPLAISSIGQQAAAIKLAQRTAGYDFDSKSPLLEAVMSGIRREIAKTRTIRRVKPLMRNDLEDMLERLDPKKLREARDAALLALGWAGALRRSELVGLDWGKLGAAKDDTRVGYLSADEKGLVITLMTSKASQDQAETVVLPRAFAPAICDAVENWVRLAPIATGTPVFRRTDGGKLGANRMFAGTVARIVKRRVHLLVKAKSKRSKMRKEEVKALVEAFSGHSMRAGFVSSASNMDIPDKNIMQQTRHKSAAMLTVYRRDVDKYKNSGLKGVGF